MRFIVENRKIIIIIINILFICTACKNVGIDIDIPVGPSKEDIVNSIMEYDSSFDSEFLSYVYDEYGKDSLVDILSYIEGDEYEENIWYKVTGMSLNVIQD